MCIYIGAFIFGNYKLFCEVDQADHFNSGEITQSTSIVADVLGSFHGAGKLDLFWRLYTFHIITDIGKRCIRYQIRVLTNIRPMDDQYFEGICQNT